MKVLREFFRNIIKDRKTSLSQGKRLGDLMDLLVESVDDETGNALSTDDIISQCITFFFAGHDTTGHTLAWIFYLISSDPEVEKKIIAEIESVLGEKDAPSFSDLGKLSYLSNVIKESLRLYPPVNNVSRVSADGSNWEILGFKFDGFVSASICKRRT